MSNIEARVHASNNIKIQGFDTQAEETIGVESVDEQTDFDNELFMLKLLSQMQNELAAEK